MLAPTGRHITAQVKRGAKWGPESHPNRAQAWVVGVTAKNPAATRRPWVVGETGNWPSTRRPWVVGVIAKFDQAAMDFRKVFNEAKPNVFKGLGKIKKIFLQKSPHLPLRKVSRQDGRRQAAKDSGSLQKSITED